MSISELMLQMQRRAESGEGEAAFEVPCSNNNNSNSNNNNNGRTSASTKSSSGGSTGGAAGVISSGASSQSTARADLSREGRARERRQQQLQEAVWELFRLLGSQLSLPLATLDHAGMSMHGAGLNMGMQVRLERRQKAVLAMKAAQAIENAADQGAKEAREEGKEESKEEAKEEAKEEESTDTQQQLSPSSLGSVYDVLYDEMVHAILAMTPTPEHSRTLAHLSAYLHDYSADPSRIQRAARAAAHAARHTSSGSSSAAPSTPQKPMAVGAESGVFTPPASPSAGSNTASPSSPSPGGGHHHRRRSQELIGAPRRFVNMEAGLVFQAEALLVTPKGSDFSITFWIYLTQVQYTIHYTHYTLYSPLGSTSRRTPPASSALCS
jgi:hypothetical protein